MIMILQYQLSTTIFAFPTYRFERTPAPPRSNPQPIHPRRSTFGPSLRASRGDPVRRLTAWVPPCSRSVQRSPTRIAPRFPRPSPAEGPRPFRQCRSGPTGAPQQEAKRETNSRGRWNLQDAGRSAFGQRVAEVGRPSARRRISPPLSPPNGMVREVSEDGWGGRRQDPLAKAPHLSNQSSSKVVASAMGRGNSPQVTKIPTTIRGVSPVF